jgi:hypothetical protein
VQHQVAKISATPGSKDKCSSKEQVKCSYKELRQVQLEGDKLSANTSSKDKCSSKESR